MCCYNRPYDPQEQLRIVMETQSKLYIQQMIKDGKMELIGSYILDYECGNVPSSIRRKAITDFIQQNISGYVGLERDEVISKKAKMIMEHNIKKQDAYHVASAIYANCDYFVSTDKRLLKYKTSEIKMLNPIDLVVELEDS